MFNTKKLTVCYLTALSLIALLIISAHILVRIALRKQNSDALVINLAGRQRMLSQKLTKEALLLAQRYNSIEVKEYYRQMLAETAANWSQVHNGLQFGDKELKLPKSESREIRELFAELEPYYQTIKSTVDKILALESTELAQLSIRSALIQDIVESSPLFLEWMDKIVFQYDKEAEARVRLLKLLEIYILATVLLLLSFEAVCVFRPMVNKVKIGYENLQRADEELREHHNQLEELVKERTAKLLTINKQLQGEIKERKLAEQEAMAYREKLQGLTSELSIVEERERRRLAAIVHDNIGQNLAFVKLTLQSLIESAPSPNMLAPLDKICATIDKTIQDAHSLTFELSNPVLYELGFVAAVEQWLSEQVQDKYGIKCKFTGDSQCLKLDNEISVILFQAVRELLVNTVKHAKAKTVQIDIQETGDRVQVSVKDDGVGFVVSKLNSSFSQSKTGGFGLFNIQERLEYLGGEMKIESTPTEGTCVILIFPVKRKEQKAEGKRVLV